MAFISPLLCPPTFQIPQGQILQAQVCLSRRHSAEGLAWHRLHPRTMLCKARTSVLRGKWTCWAFWAASGWQLGFTWQPDVRSTPRTLLVRKTVLASCSAHRQLQRCFRRRPLQHPHGVWGYRLGLAGFYLSSGFLKQPRTIHPHHLLTGPASPLGIKISFNLDRRLQCFGTCWQIALYLNHCVNLNSTASLSTHQQQVWDTGLFARGTV